jgi:serine/threonine protein kinase
MGDTPGTVLGGRYELLERAGAGGMAVVWRARTLGVGGFTRAVAIKRIAPHLAANEGFIEMFVEEARVVSRLGHPLIAQVHDFGVDDDGRHFIVMEWVEGIDLSDLGESYLALMRPVPWPIVAAIGIEALGALESAHNHKGRDGTPAPVFHRDVTPQNIRLSVEGFVKLTDFGIARAMDRTRSMTSPGSWKGKLSYLAPEQVHGGPASPRTDVFSLAVCMWETLAGQKLFEAPTDMQVVFQVEAAEIPDARALRPDVPASLWEVLKCALARDPKDRFQSAHSMARALAHLLRTTTNELTHSRRIAEIVHIARQQLGYRSLFDDDPTVPVKGGG